MSGIILTVSMFVLLIVSLMMTIIILMQKPSANAGMGAALGGGAAESVFGGETANVLLKYTVRISVAFFLISFILYVGYLWHHRSVPATVNSALPTMPGAANATTAPANGTAAPASSASAAGSGFNVTAAKPAGSAAGPAAAAASATPAASTPAAASAK